MAKAGDATATSARAVEIKSVLTLGQLHEVEN